TSLPYTTLFRSQGDLSRQGDLSSQGDLPPQGDLTSQGDLPSFPRRREPIYLKMGPPPSRGRRMDSLYRSFNLFTGASTSLPELQPLYRSFNLFTGAPTSLTGASTWLPRPEADLLADLEIAAEVAAVPGAQGLHADAVAGGDGAQRVAAADDVHARHGRRVHDGRRADVAFVVVERHDHHARDL